MRRRFSKLATALAVAASTFGAAQGAQAMSLGFNDVDGLQRYGGFYNSPVNEPALRAGLANAREAGARDWRLMIRWSHIARGPVPPSPESAAADPAWAGYDWSVTDRLMKAVTSAGLTPILSTFGAPAWAEGPNRPPVSSKFPAGTWKPSAGAYGEFGKALARRYDGTYPDPAAPGQTLPKLTNFHVWNEPNLWVYLTPQWVESKGRWKAESASQYRKLHRAFAKGVRSVRGKDARLIMAATAPFGALDKRNDPRIPPAEFDRQLLCVTQRGKKATGRRSCPKLDIDGWAHNSYPIGPPWRTASNKDDVVVPDTYKLRRIFNAAAKAKTVSRKGARNPWVTEISWESKPDPEGLSLERQAFYMQGALYMLWRGGVKHAIWWNSRDDVEGAGWDKTHQSGIFARGANPHDPTQDIRKPSYTAFHFPFAAFRKRGVAKLWTQPPVKGTVTVEALKGGTWRKVRTLKRRGDIATADLYVGTGVQLRARVGDETSLTWKTF